MDILLSTDEIRKVVRLEDCYEDVMHLDSTLNRDCELNRALNSLLNTSDYQITLIKEDSVHSRIGNGLILNVYKQRPITFSGFENTNSLLNLIDGFNQEYERTKSKLLLDAVCVGFYEYLSCTLRQDILRRNILFAFENIGRGIDMGSIDKTLNLFNINNHTEYALIIE